MRLRRQQPTRRDQIERLPPTSPLFIPAHLDQGKPMAPGSQEFWDFFDSLPPKERKLLNEAPNGPDLVARYQGVLARNWK